MSSIITDVAILLINILTMWCKSSLDHNNLPLQLIVLTFTCLPAFSSLSPSESHNLCNRGFPTFKGKLCVNIHLCVLWVNAVIQISHFTCECFSQMTPAMHHLLVHICAPTYPCVLVPVGQSAVAKSVCDAGLEMAAGLGWTEVDWFMRSRRMVWATVTWIWRLRPRWHWDLVDINTNQSQKPCSEWG